MNGRRKFTKLAAVAVLTSLAVLASCDEDQPTDPTAIATGATAAAKGGNGNGGGNGGGGGGGGGGAPVPLSQVAGGGSWHTCALTSDGTAYCWGRNDSGQLGVSGGDKSKPVLVNTDVRFVQLTLGNRHTCGLTSQGTAYCWGGNWEGQLGDGVTKRFGRPGSKEPMAVSGGLTFSSLTTGYAFTCGVTAGGVYCWGENSRGQLGTGDTSNRLVPTLIAGGGLLNSVEAFWSHACGLTSAGAAYCWGRNHRGQLGIGVIDILPSTTPTAVSGGLTFSEMSLGNRFTCALTTDGTAYCWGQNNHGELGTTATTEVCSSSGLPCSSTPLVVSGGVQFEEISAGDGDVCGLTISGTAYCWGRNHVGQLGDGSLVDRSVPAPVAGQLAFARVGLGGFHSCGSTVGGITYCWGSNKFAQVGDGTKVDRSTPTQVSGQQ